MATYRTQKQLTITEEQRQTLIDNYGKMDKTKLAKLIGETYNKTVVNLRIMGLAHTRAKVIQMQPREDYFDEIEFSKYYRY